MFGKANCIIDGKHNTLFSTDHKGRFICFFCKKKLKK